MSRSPIKIPLIICVDAPRAFGINSINVMKFQTAAKAATPELPANANDILVRMLTHKTDEPRPRIIVMPDKIISRRFLILMASGRKVKLAFGLTKCRSNTPAAIQ